MRKRKRKRNCTYQHRPSNCCVYQLFYECCDDYRTIHNRHKLFARKMKKKTFCQLSHRKFHSKWPVLTKLLSICSVAALYNRYCTNTELTLKTKCGRTTVGEQNHYLAPPQRANAVTDYLISGRHAIYVINKNTIFSYRYQFDSTTPMLRHPFPQLICRRCT